VEEHDERPRKARRGAAKELPTSTTIGHLILRGLFIAIAIGAGFYGWQLTKNELADPYIGVWVLSAAAGAVAITLLDVVYTKRFLKTIAAVVFGLLIGFLAAAFVGYVLDVALDPLKPSPEAMAATKLLLTLAFCYLGVSFVIQTKDDFRVVIPYVQFAREIRGPRPFVVDTSVIIDGRIADIAETNILKGGLVVPRYVLDELHSIADSADKLRRNRGRRGLDMLNRLRANPKIQVEIEETPLEPGESVDQKLVDLAKSLNGVLVTNDFNLNKVATLQGMDVVNINELAKALRPVVLPGEELSVRIVRPGEEAGQGVGYLEDGTMVVVEDGRDHIGQEVLLVVTSTLQTSAGRMLFGKLPK
jgi:uncharacterized protein YacL